MAPYNFPSLSLIFAHKMIYFQVMSNSVPISLCMKFSSMSYDITL